MSPRFSLRSYLEGKGDLSLAKLRCILRACYQEKDVTELYVELPKAVHESQMLLEKLQILSPQDFLVRLLDLRQKK